MTARAIALSGLMGSGKSTVGARLAERVGVPFIDVDRVIASEVGAEIGAIFARDGEAAFRAREGEVVRRLLAEAAASATTPVLALGGGAVTSASLRRLLVDRAIVVTLDASVATLVGRLGGDAIAKRPLLVQGGDPVATLNSILAARRSAYAEAHARIDVDGRSIDEVTDAVHEVWRRDPIGVPLGERSYAVDVRRGALGALAATLDRLTARGCELLIVSDDAVWPLVGGAIESALAGSRARLAGSVIVRAGEMHKTIATVEEIWDAALLHKLDRRGIVLAVGGGVVGDMAGFAAATLLRGVRVVQVPTTLLAVVDASVGGKTAIDRPQGKNLIGAFHQPSAVIADVDLLATLPIRELRSGLAEVVKMALIADAALFESLEANADALARGDLDAVAQIVRAPIAHKARIVGEDERDETDVRAVLNLGHTFGHALETHGGFARWTHGEAVGLGTLAALRVGVAEGWTDPTLPERTERLLDRIGLPTKVDHADVVAALAHLGADKKREGASIAYVIVSTLGHARIERVTLDALRARLT